MTSEKDFRIEGDKLIRYLGDASNVKIPEGVRMIGEGAFKDDTTLISVTIPEGCEGIEEGAFQWCSALEIVHAPDLIMAVGLNAFAGTRFVSGKHGFLKEPSGSQPMHFGNMFF